MIGMYLDYTADQRALRTTLREYFDQLLREHPAPGAGATGSRRTAGR